MDGPRAPRDQEFPSIVKFLDEHLRPGLEWSIVDEYPIAFSLNNRPNIRVIYENDKIASHAVIKNLFIKNPYGISKVAAIGSVVTHPDFRNKGLSQKIIESCLQAAQEQRCDFAILWTDLYDFYRRFDFELAGSELSFTIHRKILHDNLESLKFLNTSKISPEALLKVYSKHTVASMRTLEEIKFFMDIPKTKIYTAWDANNNIKAYAVVGRGADLTGYIHEWGGGVQELFALFNYIREDQKSDITLISPIHAQNLVAQLQKQGFQPSYGFLGMIHIINPNDVFFKVQRYARSIGLDDMIIEVRNNTFVIGHKDQLFSTTSKKDITRLIFGPTHPSDIFNFDAKALDILEKVLPVPMWVWGWDSV